MTVIKITTKGYERKMTALEKKQVPFAVSKTLNELARGLATKELRGEANKTFEGGATAYSKGAFRYAKSTKRKLSATVYVDLKTREYMKYQIDGGKRTPQKKKIFVPSNNIKKNKYGNLTRGKRNKIFTDKTKYFQGSPNGKSGTANEGVWERYGPKRGKKIRMVGRFVKSAKYKKKLPFKKIIVDRVNNNANGFDFLFKRNLIMALRTAK